ncbi:MAG: pyrroline-5-carboxylate reductase [Pseudomonadota bacterium]
MVERTLSKDRPIVLVGAGKMGGALLSGWLQSESGENFCILDPVLSPEMSALVEDNGVAHHQSPPHDLLASIVIVAIKPQMMADVLPNLAPLIQNDGSGQTIVVSVAAGTPVSVFRKFFSETTPIVRAMPNTPAQVGRGITIGYATPDIDDAGRDLVAKLLSVTGAFDWVYEEDLIDAVTAVSGSGPAYVFHMVEALADAARKAGISDPLAMKLARATVEGAGELLYQSDLEAFELRQNVTSPGGTTAAALSVLMANDGLTALMERAVDAAKRRAKELAD